MDSYAEVTYWGEGYGDGIQITWFAGSPAALECQQMRE